MIIQFHTPGGTMEINTLDYSPDQLAWLNLTPEKLQEIEHNANPLADIESRVAKLERIDWQTS